MSCVTTTSIYEYCFHLTHFLIIAMVIQPLCLSYHMTTSFPYSGNANLSWSMWWECSDGTNSRLWLCRKGGHSPLTFSSWHRLEFEWSGGASTRWKLHVAIYWDPRRHGWGTENSCYLIIINVLKGKKITWSFYGLIVTLMIGKICSNFIDEETEAYKVWIIKLRKIWT